MRIPIAAILAMLSAPLAAFPPAWFDRSLPVTGEMRRVADGEVSINRTRARYFLYSGVRTGECARLAAEKGWKPGPTPGRTIETPSGHLDIWLFRRREDSRILLLAEPEGAGGRLALAVLEREPEWEGKDGEAPGCDPEGIPRFGSARRILCLAGGRGKGWWYSSLEKPAWLLDSAQRAMEVSGWTVSRPAEGSLLAVRDGFPVVSVHVRPAEKGSIYLLIATRREN